MIWRYALSGLIFAVCYLMAGVLIGTDTMLTQFWRSLHSDTPGVDIAFVTPLLGATLIGAITGLVVRSRERRRLRQEAPQLR